MRDQFVYNKPPLPPPGFHCYIFSKFSRDWDTLLCETGDIQVCTITLQTLEANPWGNCPALQNLPYLLEYLRKTQIENYFGLLIQILCVSPYNFIKHKHLIFKEWCLDTSWFYLCSFLFPVCMYFLEEDCKSELAKKSPIILK